LHHSDAVPKKGSILFESMTNPPTKLAISGTSTFIHICKMQKKPRCKP